MKKNENKFIKTTKSLKILILSILVLVLLISCDENSEKNLLTFYYQAEDFAKKEIIQKLAKGFYQETGIKVIAKEYFADNLNRILDSEDNRMDVIEINYLNLSDFEHEKYLINFDSISRKNVINREYPENSYFIPYINEIYVLCIFYPEWEEKIKLPINNLDKLYKESVKIDESDYRAFGLVVNDGKNSVNNFFTFLNWNGGEIILISDSISFNNEFVIKTLEYYRKLAPYSYLGTLKEVENEYFNKKIKFFLANSSYFFRIISGTKYSTFLQIKNDSNNFTGKFIKNFLGISKKTKKDNLAVLFINYLCNERCLNKFHDHDYANIFLDFMNYGSLNDKVITKNMQEIEKMKILYSSPLFNEINRAISQAIYGQEPIPEIVEKTQDKINKIYKSKKHK